MTERCDFDLSGTLSRLDNDTELYKELFAIFESEYPNWIERIKSAIADRDSKKLTHEAHAIKGALANVGASYSSSIALKLEKLGSAGDINDAQALYEQLIHAVEAFKENAKAKLVNI